MKRLFLFPRKFRMIGLIILIPAIVYWLAIGFYDFSFSFLHYHNSKGDSLPDGYDRTVDYALLLVGLVFIAFSKLRDEDEMSVQLRFQTFQISIYLSLIILAILDFFVYGFDYVFYSTMLWYIFIVLFIIIFYTKIYLLNKSANNEK